MVANVKIEQHIGLLKYFARQVCGRLAATGTHTTQFEDVVQELAIAWCQARDHWDETKGVPFVAYLKRGMIQHINKWAGKEIFHYNASHVELDAALPGDDTSDRHAIIADVGSADPEDQLVLKDRREKALAKLSPRARQFVELIETPPKCLVDLVGALAARRRFALDRGLNTPGTPKRVLPAMVFRLMGCSRLEQTQIMAELEKKFNVKAALAEIDRVN